MTVKGGASELMRTLGLLVDGPVRWGKQVRSRAPGVFVVELPGGRPVAPIDDRSLSRWLERVPGLLVDGEPATNRTLVRRLAEFWLPDEPVLYVGRSTRALGGRVASLYATPLGDVRPHPGGHWLKTLWPLDELTVWWAETDAGEEYEDALLSAVGARVEPAVAEASPDPDVILPFANLQTATGTAKRHGIEGSLREPPEIAAPTAEGATSPAAGSGSRRVAARRTLAAPGPSRGTAPAGGRAATAKSQPPAPPPTYLSAEGLDRHAAELKELRTGVRPGVIARVKAARELGDLRENAEYEYARKEQSFVEGRIQELEALVRSAVVVGSTGESDVVAIGSSVVLETEGEEVTFVLVGSSEADPAAGRISYVSPVGRALLGRRPGDEVVVKLPRGEMTYRVRAVR